MCKSYMEGNANFSVRNKGSLKYEKFPQINFKYNFISDKR